MDGGRAPQGGADQSIGMGEAFGNRRQIGDPVVERVGAPIGPAALPVPAQVEVEHAHQAGRSLVPRGGNAQAELRREVGVGRREVERQWSRVRDGTGLCAQGDAGLPTACLHDLPHGVEE